MLHQASLWQLAHKLACCSICMGRGMLSALGVQGSDPGFTGKWGYADADKHTSSRPSAASCDWFAWGPGRWALVHKCHALVEIRVHQHGMKKKDLSLSSPDSTYTVGKLTITAAWHGRRAVHLSHLTALRDCQNCRISRPYRDAQDRLLWRDKLCPAHT